MLDINLLETLVTFEECQTLSKTAESLYISQPALTKQMRKLESDLGVILFIRKKNHIELNETGKFAAKYAKRILSNINEFQNNVIKYEQSLTGFSVAFCSEIPEFILSPIIDDEFPNYRINKVMDDDKDFYNLLDKRVHQLIVTHIKPQDNNKYYYKKCGHETLYLSVPKNHILSQRIDIGLKELEKVSVLTYTKMGFWNQWDNIKFQKIHHLIQTDHSTYAELIQTTSYPCFITSYFVRRGIQLPKRIDIKIKDSEFNCTYYLVCLKSDKEKFEKIFNKIDENTVS